MRINEQPTTSVIEGLSDPVFVSYISHNDPDIVVFCGNYNLLHSQNDKNFTELFKRSDVAIELDLSSSEVENMLQEFWVLNQLDELALVYLEIKTFLPSFLKLFHCLKEHYMLSEKNISDILKYAGNDLPQLTDRVQCLTIQIINLEGQNRDLMNKVILWNAQLSDLGKAIDIKNQQLKRLGVDQNALK